MGMLSYWAQAQQGRFSPDAQDIPQITYESNEQTGYTYCKSQAFNSTWFTVLCGTQLTAAQIKAGVDALIAEYRKVFDPQSGQPTQYATTKCTPYMQQPATVLSPGQQQLSSQLANQKPDANAQTTGPRTNPVMPDGRYSTTKQAKAQHVLLFYKPGEGFEGNNFFREAFQAPNSLTKVGTTFEFGKKLYQL